jgi:putative Mn2+ efflux pump MntP
VNFLKNLGGRLAYLIVGVVLTVLGAFLIYLEFKSNQRYSSVNSSWSSYPFIILVLGLASIAVAFSKNINAGSKENKSDPPKTS